VIQPLARAATLIATRAEPAGAQEKAMLDSTAPTRSPATDRPPKITTLPHNLPSCAPIDPRRFG